MPETINDWWTPLDAGELRIVQKALSGTSLTLRVIHQLKQQEHYNLLERAHRETIGKSISEQLADLVEAVENLEEIASEHADCE